MFSMKIGLGFDLNTILNKSNNESVFYTNNVNTSELYNLYFPLKFKGYFLEPEISYVMYKIGYDYEEENDSDRKHTFSSFSYSIGIYKYLTKDKLDIYAGIRLGVISLKEKQEYTLNTIIEKTEKFILSPALGLEYNLNKNISICSEIIYLNIFDSEDNSDEEGEYTRNRTWGMLQPKFIIRFYLPI